MNGGSGDLPQWIQTGVALAAVGFFLGLWLKGFLRRTADVEREKAALKEVQDARVAAAQARIDALVADRDAWRTAHSEEAAARRAAEQSAQQLMETSNIALGLLSALKDVMARTPPPTSESGQ